MKKLFNQSLIHTLLLFLPLLLFLLLGGTVFTGCSNDSGVLGDPESLEVASSCSASSKSLAQLMQTDWEDMTEADVDRLNLLTGSMSAEEYTSKYPCGGDPSSLTDTGAQGKPHPVLDAITGAIWGKWKKVDIPGAECSNGSQYKIFIMKSKGFYNWIKGYTKNLLIYLEPGGACWDYPSCSGKMGIRGAANPNGIPDNFMNLGDFIDPNKEGGSPNAAISPLILYNHPTGQNVETSRWNKVFIPYCTGDVHSGNKVTTYEDPTGENPPLTFRHLGATNIEKVIKYLKKKFKKINKLMVTGCSAGGVGALTNYHFFRKELKPKKSFLLDDSGPIFSATAEGEGNHWYLHQEIKQVWNTDYLLDRLISDVPEFPFVGDYGQIHEALAYEYPNDELGMTFFKRDANFSMYSYERFFGLDEDDPEEFEQILDLWAEDIQGMVNTYDSIDNLSYFIPYYRKINSSHCTCIIEFTGTEIENTGIDARDYIKDLLNGGSTQSYEEVDNPSDADVTSFIMEIVDLFL